MINEEQKVAVITGAGAGIGRAYALRFANDNYKVLVVDLSEDAVEQTSQSVKEIGGECAGFSGDIAIEDTSHAACEVALSHWGRIDVVVANAGIQTSGTLLDTSEEDWDSVLGINLKGVAYSCKAALPSMIKYISYARSPALHIYSPYIYSNY